MFTFQVMGGKDIGDDKPRIFSPFGLGVLDIAVGLTVLTIGTETGHANEVPDFFADVERW